MTYLLEILKLLIPAGIAFATSYFLVKAFLDNESRKRATELRHQVNETLIPIRLQAYERLIIFLDRTNPESLVARIQKPGMSAAQLLQEINQTVKAEFDHNVSQQIYVSPRAWEMVKISVTETQKIFQLAASKVDGTASCYLLGQIISQISSQLLKLPAQAGTEYLNREVALLFGIGGKG